MKLNSPLKSFKNIDEIVTQDEKWRKFALKIAGGDDLDADEILHRVYENYMKMKVKPEKINSGYVHTALTNNYIKLIKERQKSSYFHEDNFKCDQDYYVYDNEVKDNEEYALYISILNDIENLDMFNKKIFILHVIDGMKMREIERVYGLSFYTVQLSIATTKKMIKNKYI